MTQAKAHRVSSDPGSLERALEVALAAHAGQELPSGAPYILHPLRIAVHLLARDEQVAAILHDVLEKNDAWTMDKLRAEGFNDSVLEAVDALTRRKGESFLDAVARGAHDLVARAVKRADIVDHIKYFPKSASSNDYPEALLMLLAPESGPMARTLLH